MDRSRLGSAINCGNLHQYVVGCRFCIIDKQVEISVLAKDAGVDQLELGFLFVSASIFLTKPRVRKLILWIFIESFQIRMSWRRIEIVINFLHIFAMVPLAVRHTNQSL